MKRIYERIVVSDVPPTSGEVWIDTSGNVPILKTGAGFEWESPISPSDDGGSDDDTDYGQYFTIEATQDGTKVYFRQSSHATDEGIDPLKVEVSTDNGETWEEITAAPAEDDVPGAILAELDEGGKVLIRGNNEAYGYYSESEDDYIENCNFFADNPCYVYGNIMSLIGDDDFASLRSVEEYAFTDFFSDYDGAFDWSWVLSKEGEELLLPATTLGDYCYCYMFAGCTGLTIAPALPATTLADFCYSHMFESCEGLTSAPVLPATTLANNCYEYMFYSCFSLISAPELPATSLAKSCYFGMFFKCTGLTSAPELPATTLAIKCYNSMFSSCIGLTSAPELPATSLVEHCYSSMFKDCTNLSYIKAMFTTISGGLYTLSWVYNVKSTGTFVKNSVAAWDVTGDNGVPTGWTVQTADA